jgi:hypothetical protein
MKNKTSNAAQNGLPYTDFLTDFGITDFGITDLGIPDLGILDFCIIDGLGILL